MKKVKNTLYQFLRWLEKYTKTDMVYVFEGSFWWILGRIFSFSASFLSFVIFGRLVSPETFGLYQYVLSMNAILGIFCLGGIDTALIRVIAKGIEGSFFTAIKEKFKFGLIATLLSFFISFWYFFHKNNVLGFSFIILGIFLPFLGTFISYLTIWHGRKEFEIENRYLVLHNLLAVSLLIFFVLLFKDNPVLIILGYFLGYTLGELIFFLKTIKTIKKVHDVQIEKETISLGKHLTIMGLPGAISAQIDNVIIWQTIGSSALAIYSFALRLIERLQEIVPFSALALPKMAEKNLKDGEIKKRIFDKFLKLFLLSIPLSLFYIFFCPFFFQIFFPRYKESIIYSQFLSLTLMFSPFSFLSTVFLAEGRKEELYILNTLPQIIKILLFFILIPTLKIWGGVFAILIAQIFYSGLTLYLFQKF